MKGLRKDYQSSALFQYSLNSQLQDHVNMKNLKKKKFSN